MLSSLVRRWIVCATESSGVHIVALVCTVDRVLRTYCRSSARREERCTKGAVCVTRGCVDLVASCMMIVAGWLELFRLLRSSGWELQWVI